MEQNSINSNDIDEISLEDFFRNFKKKSIYIKSKVWWILLFGIIGSLLGCIFVYIQPVKYISKLSFIIEDGKSGTSGLASLVGQFGFDLGGNGGNTLLSGENLILFLKSKSLITTTLLTAYGDSSKNYSLADKYAETYQLKSKWEKNKKIGVVVTFPTKKSFPFTRLQDSLLQSIIENILKKELIVERPEKKATFVDVQTTMQDELLSKWFCERLVNEAINRYINTKTIRQKTNVDRLQRRADSIGQLLNYKTFSSASANEKILDINPAYRSSTVNAEVIGRDKTMLGIIYSEVVKNLEISKVQLTQETPTIQIIDDVKLPLKTKRLSFLIYSVGSFFIFCIISVTILIIYKKEI